MTAGQRRSAALGTGNGHGSEKCIDGGHVGGHRFVLRAHV